MKKLIYTFTFTLVIGSSVPTAWTKNPNDAKIFHLRNSATVPNNARTQDAIHKFDVHVQGKALSELTIDFPEGVSIRANASKLLLITTKLKNQRKNQDFAFDYF
ncbi:hypothetical protein [Nostoc sp. CCY 9925]|uniref:hypothetical protein n=1 Tax=Nostoc sp. CCY 9925 TaxID=3103865 RepID=UPI0039C68CCD